MASKRTLGFSATILRKKFGAAMTVRNYRDKEVVFSQGDTADALFYIQSGTVKLTWSPHAARKPSSPSCSEVAFLVRVV